MDINKRMRGERRMNAYTASELCIIYDLLVLPHEKMKIIMSNNLTNYTLELFHFISLALLAPTELTL
jgi:hypothetical protein